MNGYLSYNGLQRFWSKVKSYIDNKFNEASSTTPKQTYSTEEHVVGTWIDGRDIYEKTYYRTNVNTSSASDGFEIVLEERSDIAEIIDSSGYIDCLFLALPGHSGVAAKTNLPSHMLGVYYYTYYTRTYLSLFCWGKADDFNPSFSGTVCVTVRYIKAV